MSDTTEQTIRSHVETCDTVWPGMPADSEKEHLSIVVYGQVGNGRSASTGRYLFELGGIPEREPDEVMQEAIRPGRSSFAFAFYMHKQTEEKKLGVDIACSTKELLTETWNSITINAPGYKDLIDMNTSATQYDEAFIMMPASDNPTTADAKGYYNAGKIQGQTRQPLRLINRLGTKQNYTGENEMDCVTVGHEQEWYDETSSDLKLMCNVRFSARSWSTTDSSMCKQLSLFFVKSDSAPQRRWNEDAVQQC